MSMFTCLYGRKESNPHRLIRSQAFYPLNYFRIREFRFTASCSLNNLKIKKNDLANPW